MFGARLQGIFSAGRRLSSVSLRMDKKIYSAFVTLCAVVVVACVLAASSRNVAGRAQARRPTPRRGAGAKPAASSSQKPAEAPATVKLTDEESRMAQGSRAAIIATGFSESYFDAHFRLARIVNQPGDRRVVWKYSINEYEVLVHDSLGYRTEAGKRIDIHSVGHSLGATRDIERTVARSVAERLLRACLGRRAPSQVVFQPVNEGQRSTLYLTAQAAGEPGGRGAREEREREERARRERGRREQKRNGGGIESIETREDDDEGPPFFIAYVNLETGKCVKTRGISR
jgi:hypothetical protein